MGILKKTFKTDNIEDIYKTIINEGTIQILATNNHKYKTNIIQYIHNNYTEPVRKLPFLKSKKLIEKCIKKNNVKMDEDHYDINNIKEQSDKIITLLQNEYDGKNHKRAEKYDDKTYFMDSKEFKKKQRKYVKQQKKESRSNGKDITTQKNNVFLCCDD